MSNFLQSSYKFPRLLYFIIITLAFIILSTAFIHSSLQKNNFIKEKENLLDKINKSRETLLSSYFIERDTDNYTLDLKISISCPKNKIIESAVLRINPNLVLNPILNNRLILGQYSEIILFKKQDGNIVCLDELNHKNNSELKFIFPLTVHYLPASQYLQVESYTNTIHGTSRHLLNKINGSEICSIVPGSFRTNLITSLIYILTIGMGITFIWRKIIKEHFKKLIKAQDNGITLRNYYEDIVKNANDIIFITDENGDIKFANKKAINIYGYNEQELLNLSIRDILGDSKFFNKEELAERINTDKGIVIERTHKRKDGSIFPVEESIQIIEAEGKKLFQSFARDITERRLAEEKLKESETKYRLISNVVSDYVFSTSIEDDGKLFLNWVAGAFTELTGYSIEEYKNAGGWRGRLYPEDLKIDDADIGKLRSNIEVITELRTIKKNGEIIWVRVYAHPVWDEVRNKLIGIFGAVQNINNQKVAEETLRKSENRFRTIFDSINDAIFIHELNTGKIIDVNGKVFELYGYTRNEILQLNIEDLSSGIPPFTQMHALEWIKKANSEGPQIFLWNAKDRKGRLFWVEVNMRISDISGIKQILLVVRDITDRKLAEEELMRKTQELSILNTISNKINQSLLLDVVIQKTIDQLYLHLNPRSAFLYLLENDQMTLKAFSVGSDKENDKSSEEIKVAEHMCELVLNDNRAVYSANISNDPRCQWDDCKNAGIRSFAAIPIRKVQDIIGAIGLSSVEERDFIRQSEFLEAIVGQISTAINKANLYKNLLESEELFKKAFKASPDSVNINRLEDGLYIDINDGFTQITGYTRDDVIGKSSIELNIWGDPEVRKKLVQDLREKGHVKNLVTKFRRKDGSLLTGLMSAIIIDINGSPHNLTITRDIDDIVKTQNALSDSEQKYRSLVEHNPDGIFVVDFDGNFLSVNKAIINSLGYSENELLSMNFWAIVPGKYLEMHKERLKKITNSQIPNLPMEYEIIRKNGERLLVEVRSVPYYKENKVIGFQGIARDITEWKKAQEELIKLTSAIKQSPISVLITDKFGNIEYANPKLTEISGYSMEELKGKNPRIFQSGNKTSDEYKDMWYTILHGKIWTGEFYNKRKNGTFYWESASISPIKDKEGNINSFIALKEDITEKKKNISELIIAKEKAEEAIKTKNLFLANMSHELRTPLIGILGYSEMLSESLSDTDYGEMAKGIKRSGKRLLTTLNLLLDMTRIESERFDLVILNKDINEELEFVYKMFQGAAAEKKIKFSLDILDEELSAKVDSNLLTVILENLVNNAIKFTNSGGITIKAGKLGRNKVFIKVIDTGIGIDPKYFSRIFEEFRQVSEGINREFQGTGLGLSIAKKYVDMLNGTIEVESKIGEGSTFTVTFPSF